MKKEGRKNFYHRYFEGYTEEKVLVEGGRGAHIQRTYTGFYYHAQLTSGQRWGVRALYLFLYLASAALFVFAASRPVPCNSTWYCVVPDAVVLFSMVWLVLPFCSYLVAGERLTVYEYKSTSRRLIKFSRIIAAALGVGALLVALATVLVGGDRVEGFRCAFWFLLAAVPMAAIFLIERQIIYEQLTNPNGVW